MGSSKWIGGVLGAIFGGPVGAVAGFGIGCLVDRFVARLDNAEDDQPPLRTRSSTGARPGRGAAESRRESAAPRPQADEFSICICVLIAGVMKSDGEVRPEEITLVERRLRENFHFDDAGVSQMLGFIRELAQGDWQVEEFALRAKRHLKLPARRNLLYFLLEIAYANGQYVFAEQQVIRTIATLFGIRAAEVEAMEASLNRTANDWAYQTLELARNASEVEVKRAYRRLAKLHHPDRVAGQGEVAEAAATRKFQAINAAYEEIKKERNFN